ncbi:MAG: ATP-binding protein, partial [Chloroflexi bacterium]|nr:ATP-binding protein [Chloroflexota bacterium]
MRIIEAQEQCLRWEMDRGRGGDAIQPFPVHLEPPFTFFQHTQPGKARQLVSPPPQFTKVKVPPLSALSFLNVKLSYENSYIPDAREQLPLALGSRYPVAFEVMGMGGKVILQFIATKPDAPNVIGQLQSHYPEAQIVEAADPISNGSPSFKMARTYRLRDSHLFQIRSESRPESYTALIGILASLREGEAGLFQVLFHPVRHPWHENMITVATDSWDPSKSSFVDLPDLPRKARSKIERPLFAVSVRLAASSPDVLSRLERSFLSQFQSMENGLVSIGPLYPIQAVIGRFTHSPGMLLNARELAALVHLPDPATTPGIPVITSHEAQAPAFAKQNILIPLGVNRYRGVETPVGIPSSWLPMHVAIFGVPGSGKSNLLTWFLAAVEAGYGLAFLDPAGDTAEWFL